MRDIKSIVLVDPHPEARKLVGLTYVKITCMEKHRYVLDIMLASGTRIDIDVKHGESFAAQKKLGGDRIRDATEGRPGMDTDVNPYKILELVLQEYTVDGKIDLTVEIGDSVQRYAFRSFWTQIRPELMDAGVKPTEMLEGIDMHFQPQTPTS